MTYVPQHKTNLIIAAAAMPSAGASAAGPLLPRATTPRWRRASRRTLVLALLAAAVPVTVTAAVVELTNDPPPKEAPLPTLGAGPGGHVIDRNPLPRLPTALGDAYARLALPATADDRDGQGVVHALAAQSKQFGLSPDRARVMATVDGYRIWLIPGNGYLCIGVQALGDREMGNGCATEAVALRDGLNVSTTEQVFGLLPDGVHQIEVTDDSGLRHVEPVVDNVYELAPVSATVRYRVATGEVVSFRIVV